MQPQAQTGVAEGSLGGYEVPMTIDPAAMAHLMSVMTNLYSDPTMAVIREYSTNAWDSHIEAGNTLTPIQITTPSQWSPFFVVKDQGIGMDKEDIVRVYSKYGASTKRGTDTQTGMLGLGGKSALAITNQFTVTGIKNGVKTVISVSRVDTGSGSMEIVAETPTMEHNGVEISIPIRFNNAFSDKVSNFFRFWKPGQVEVNGKEPDFITGQDIGDGMVMVPGKLDGGDRIVMGGVAYPVEGNGLFDEYRYNSNFTIIAYVKIGDVHFVPSREQLNMGDLTTKDTIKRLQDSCKANLKTLVVQDIDAAPTHSDALDRYIKWNGMFLQSGMMKGVTYNGEIIPVKWNGTFYVYQPNKSGYYGKRARKGYTATELNHESIRKGIIIINFDKTQVSTTHKRKAVQWAADNGKSDDLFTFADANPGFPWIDTQAVEFSEIAAVKLPSNGTGGGGYARPKRQFTWDILDSNGYFVQKDDIDVSKPIYYYSPAQKQFEGYSGALTAFFSDATIACIGANRWDRFKRDYPKAIHLDAALREAAAKARDSLSPDDIEYMSLSYYSRDAVRWIDPAKVDDPKVTGFIAKIKAGSTSPRIEGWNTVSNLCQGVRVGVPRPKTSEKDVSVLSEYPLVQQRQKEDSYIYMNAKYAASKKGN